MIIRKPQITNKTTKDRDLKKNTMKIIRNVEIYGLLGRRNSVKINFDRSYNFLIGQNGTGKTTVINLIAAVLLCDIDRLEKTKFERIIINLADENETTVARISVIKGVSDQNSFPNLTYNIDDPSNNIETSFNLEIYPDPSAQRVFSGRNSRMHFYHEHFNSVKNRINSLLHVRWLSVHRINIASERDEESRNQSTVDRKLNELRSNISIYFGRLSKNYSDRILDFQQASLLSMIRNESGFTLERFSKEIDIEKERETLGNVFTALQVSPRKYEDLLETHSKAFKKAAEKIDSGRGVNIDDLATVYNGWKAHVLIQEYDELEKKKSQIFAPRDIFLKTVNSLLEPRKEISISSRNELIVKVCGQKDEIEFEDLSSGEKQLLIILGEALLQESASVIYIADEPELSLHVKWQERLTESIKAVNENVQIIFATHSPDIVHMHDDKVIDMELI
ncbi:hypothetical protein D3C81_832810 [compost metagenome]